MIIEANFQVAKYGCYGILQVTREQFVIFVVQTDAKLTSIFNNLKNTILILTIPSLTSSYIIKKR